MFRPLSTSPRQMLVLLSVAATVVVSCAVLASGASGAVVTWVTSVSLGPGDKVGTQGFAPRTYVTIWRPIGFCFEAEYQSTSNGWVVSSADCVSNPVHWYGTTGYGKAWCRNASLGSNDYASPVTCQTDS